MANKRNREIWAREEKERKFNAATKGLKLYPALALALTVLTLLLFLVKWAGVYNSAAEVYESPQFTGAQLLSSAFSGDYEIITETNGIGLYYNFQKDRTLIMGVFGIIALVSLAISVILSVVTLATSCHAVNAFAAAASVLALIFLVVCHFTAVNAGYPLMVGYQCNLKVCSHRSFIILPAISALLSAVPSVWACVKYLNARKILK